MRREAVTEAVSLSLTAFSDVRIVLQEVSDVKQMNNKQNEKHKLLKREQYFIMDKVLVSGFRIQDSSENVIILVHIKRWA